MTEDRTNPPDDGDLRALLHRLNNQLGIILAHAELLERKAHDDAERARATEIVRATLDAMTVTRSIRYRAEARENS
jgi:GAF domain-containing protein